MRPQQTFRLLVAIASVSLFSFLLTFFAFDYEVQNAPGQVTVETVDTIASWSDDRDGSRVLVAGALLWHPDEPILFHDKDSLEKSKSRRAVALEPPLYSDFSYADRKMVAVVGTFMCLCDSRYEETRVIRVESLDLTE